MSRLAAATAFQHFQDLPAFPKKSFSLWKAPVTLFVLSKTEQADALAGTAGTQDGDELEVGGAGHREGGRPRPGARRSPARIELREDLQPFSQRARVPGCQANGRFWYQRSARYSGLHRAGGGRRGEEDGRRIGRGTPSFSLSFPQSLSGAAGRRAATNPRPPLLPNSHSR